MKKLQNYFAEETWIMATQVHVMQEVLAERRETELEIESMINASN